MTATTPPASAPRVLITGASGYIASWTILALLARGWRVRGTVRDLARTSELTAMLSRQAGRPIDMEWAQADLSSDTGWTGAVAGCEAVVHMASPFPVSVPRSPDELIRPAREGALRVLRAARAAGVKRVAMTSSFAAVGYGWGAQRPAMLTEEHWSNPDNLADNTAYTRSKTLAERAAWDFVRSPEGQGLELVCLNPVAVIGPAMSKDASASLELVSQPLAGKLPAAPRLFFGLVDVRDVAEAHARALEVPEAAGQRFILCERVMGYREIIPVLQATAPDRRLPKGELPDWLVRFVSNFNPILKQILPELGQVRQTTSDAARRVLGWQPRPAAESLSDCARSLIQLGVV